MKIKIIKVKGKDLKPGDLFSSLGKTFWNETNLKQLEKSGVIGQKVYILTNVELSKEQKEDTIYKIEIIK